VSLSIAASQPLNHQGSNQSLACELSTTKPKHLAPHSRKAVRNNKRQKAARQLCVQEATPSTSWFSVSRLRLKAPTFTQMTWALGVLFLGLSGVAAAATNRPGQVECFCRVNSVHSLLPPPAG